MGAARVATAFVAFLLTLSLSSFAATASPPAADAAVALLDGQPIYVSEVLMHLRPAPPHVGTGALQDPRRTAFEKALRIRLLDQIARDREISAPAEIDDPALAQAYRVQTLIRQLESEHRIAAIGAEQARQYYQHDCSRLRSIDAVEVAGIVVAEQQLAEQLLPRAAAADAETFARLVEAHSIVTTGGRQGGVFARVDHDGNGAEEAIARVALAMRRSGEVGLAQGEDGHYYVLKATAIEGECERWNEALEQRLIGLLRFERREDVLNTLTAERRRKVDLEIDQPTLDRLPVPAVGDFLILESR